MLNKELLMVPYGKVPIGEFRFYCSDYTEPVYWEAYDSEGARRTGEVLYDDENDTSSYGQPVLSHALILHQYSFLLKGFIHYAQPMDVYYKNERLGKLSNGVFRCYENSSIDGTSWYGYGGYGGLTNKDKLYLYLHELYK